MLLLLRASSGSSPAQPVSIAKKFRSACSSTPQPSLRHRRRNRLHRYSRRTWPPNAAYRCPGTPCPAPSGRPSAPAPLERDLDSVAWPCEWSAAAGLRIRVATPTTLAPGQMSFKQVAVAPRHFAEADLEPSELQDLIDGLGEILKLGAGLNLRFVLRIEAGEGADASADQLRQLGDALRRASDKLQFE